MDNKAKLREYITRFQKEAKLRSYDETVPLIKEIEIFLFEQLRKDPSDVDYISALASVQLELRKGEENSINLLENFLKDHKNSLSDSEKARIYTNLGFYYSESYTIEKEIDMLEMADKYKSDYPETYCAFGLYYWDKDSFTDAEKYFEKAKSISDDFRHMFNYAAALFITGKYQKAKTIFEAIVGRYPDCEEAEYGIICCDAKSGNKNTCLKKLNVLKNRLLKKELTEIDEYRIAIVYYELEEYEGFSQVFDNKVDKWWLRDMWEYFYVLHAQGRNVDFDNLVNAELTKIQEDLYAYQTDEINEDYTKEEQKEYIEQAKKEINELKKMTSKIRNTGYRPEVELKIYPRYGCYLIDCIRHQNIDYLC